MRMNALREHEPEPGLLVEWHPAARTAVVLAVIENPWAGAGFVEDLAPLIDEVAPRLGELLAPRVA